MGWSEFIWFAVPSMALWLAAGVAVWFAEWRCAGGEKAACNKTATRALTLADGLMLTGIAVFAAFIVGIWIAWGRPPMRTMGETRLWYSFFLAAVGWAAYRRYGYPWLLTFAAAMATMFTVINLAKPEIHTAGLMPALQSVWFVPHVVVYMLSYAMLAAATVGACIGLWKFPPDEKPAGKPAGKPDPKLQRFTDGMVYAGFGLLTLGMLMGMVWAKAAWGHYWEWDPKETWALATALACLVYIHMRRQARAPRFTLWMVPVTFLLLLITWLGVNYLPAAQGSIHVY